MFPIFLQLMSWRGISKDHIYRVNMNQVVYYRKVTDTESAMHGSTEIRVNYAVLAPQTLSEGPEYLMYVKESPKDIDDLLHEALTALIQTEIEQRGEDQHAQRTEEFDRLRQDRNFLEFIIHRSTELQQRMFSKTLQPEINKKLQVQNLDILMWQAYNQLKTKNPNREVAAMDFKYTVESAIFAWLLNQQKEYNIPPYLSVRTSTEPVKPESTKLKERVVEINNYYFRPFMQKAFEDAKIVNALTIHNDQLDIQFTRDLKYLIAQIGMLLPSSINPEEELKLNDVNSYCRKVIDTWFHYQLTKD